MESIDVLSQRHLDRFDDSSMLSQFLFQEGSVWTTILFGEVRRGGDVKVVLKAGDMKENGLASL